MSGRTGVKGRRKGELGGLTTADLVVLSLLAERAMHGYDLLSEYRRQEVVDWASVSKAQLYYALSKLADLKLIAATTDDGSVRERTIYSPTQAGRDALANALAEPRWASGRTAQPFSTWLGLSIHAEPVAYQAMLRQRREWLIAEMERERASLDFINTLDSARAVRGGDIVRLVILQIEAEIAKHCGRPSVVPSILKPVVRS